MAQAPGVQVATLTAPPPRLVGPRTGLWVIAGAFQRGPIGVPVPVQSLNDVINLLGQRTSYSLAWDALDEYFRDGGVQAIVSRYAGPAAVPATLTVGSLSFTASSAVPGKGTFPSAGVWGNAVTVAILAVTGNAAVYQIQATGPIGPGGTTYTETSPILTSPQDAVTWGSTLSQLLSVVAAGSTNPPTTAAAPLTGGLDDIGNITDTQKLSAINVVDRSYGPGQVSIPGATTAAVYAGIIAHAQANNRIALLDAADTPTAATVIAAANSLTSVSVPASPTDGKYGTLLNWVNIPGIPSIGALPSPVRACPGSAFVAARMAYTDQQTGNPNQPAAGERYGMSSYALSTTQNFSDSDRALLNAAGVSIIRTVGGLNPVVELYGYASLSAQPAFHQLSSSRLNMAVCDEGRIAINQVSQFTQIDGGNKFFGACSSALAAIGQKYYKLGAFYGSSAGTAFSVDVGPNVDPVSQLAAGAVVAVLSGRFSPYAEFTTFDVVVVPITQSLAAV